MTDDDKTFEELWAWVTEDHDGRVHLVGAGLPGIGHVPLLSHAKEAILTVQNIAENHGRVLGQPVWLRRYKVAEDIGRISATLRMRN